MAAALAVSGPAGRYLTPETGNEEINYIINNLQERKIVMAADFKKKVTMDPSGFVLLADQVPGIIQEIRYYSTYNFIGDRIDGYEEPCAILTREAARALKVVSNEMNVQGYRLKVFDAYRPAGAVKHFVLWGIEDQDIRMKPYFYPDLEKQELFCQGLYRKPVQPQPGKHGGPDSFRYANRERSGYGKPL